MTWRRDRHPLSSTRRGKVPPLEQLRSAWRWRKERGILSELETVRVFHGPGEGEGEFEEVAIDRFGKDFWVTRWREAKGSRASGGPTSIARAVSEFLEENGARSAVLLERPETGLPDEPRAILGSPPEGRFEAREGPARFWIQLMGARHPGLFLDHYPLRLWLRSRASGLSVLNAFGYTGSLSVAAALGGAARVTTLDLSRATLRWAEENWKLNGLAPGGSRVIAGDYFEWMPRLRREGARFGCVILDPPSYSRGKKGDFSTSRDLVRLHEAALGVLEPGGYLITSINSAGISHARFEADLLAAAGGSSRRGLRVLARIDLPETFPTLPGRPEDRYLKGWILQAD